MKTGQTVKKEFPVSWKKSFLSSLVTPIRKRKRNKILERFDKISDTCRLEFQQTEEFEADINHMERKSPTESSLVL